MSDESNPTRAEAERRARRRLAVIELAERLGSVTEACREMGMDRTSFYAWKRRYAQHGLEGLLDRPPVHRRHPQATPPATVRKIIALSLGHPEWGCGRLSDALKREGIRLSSPTCQNILIKQGLGSRRDRLFELERRHMAGELALTPAQIAQIEKENPAFKERDREAARPGERLAVSCLPLGRAFVLAAIDAYSSYAIVRRIDDARAEEAVMFLSQEVLPFYAECGLSVQAVVTPPRPELGRGSAFGHFLDRLGIRHEIRQDGFLERFRQGLARERSARAQAESAERWLATYNERPLPGYRNLGRSPSEALQAFFGSARSEG